MKREELAATAEGRAFLAYWKGDLVDYKGHTTPAFLHAWDAWQARAALAAETATDIPEWLKAAFPGGGILENLGMKQPTPREFGAQMYKRWKSKFEAQQAKIDELLAAQKRNEE